MTVQVDSYIRLRRFGLTDLAMRISVDLVSGVVLRFIDLEEQHKDMLRLDLFDTAKATVIERPGCQGVIFEGPFNMRRLVRWMRMPQGVRAFVEAVPDLDLATHHLNYKPWTPPPVHRWMDQVQTA